MLHSTTKSTQAPPSQARRAVQRLRVLATMEAVRRGWAGGAVHAALVAGAEAAARARAQHGIAHRTAHRWMRRWRAGWTWWRRRSRWLRARRRSAAAAVDLRRRAALEAGVRGRACCAARGAALVAHALRPAATRAGDVAANHTRRSALELPSLLAACVVERRLQLVNE